MNNKRNVLLICISLLTLLLSACGNTTPETAKEPNQEFTGQACARPTLSINNPGPNQFSADVQYAQTKLLEKGNTKVQTYLNNAGGADGYFGRGTYNAVVAYQVQINEIFAETGRPGIAMDGIIGQDTWYWLDCGNPPPAPTPVASGKIVSSDLERCLDVEGQSTANGTPVQIWDCVDVPNQDWTLYSNGEIRGYGGKCLDVRGPSTDNGTPVQIWDCVGVENQKWLFSSSGQLVGYGGKCLDVRISGNGQDTDMWSCDGAIPAVTWHLGTTPEIPEKGEWLRNEMSANLARIAGISNGIPGSRDDALHIATILLLFYDKVKTGGEWDYKNDVLQPYASSGILLYGKRYANDVPGNINFGFVGITLEKEFELATFGVDAELLIKGLAGYAHANDNANKEDFAAILLRPDRVDELKRLSTLDDPLDQNAIQAGFDYLKHGGNLQDHIHNADLRQP